MLKTDEDALVCDFAETYHVYDWRSLPVKTAATLAAGLRQDARIVQKMMGVDFDRWLMAGIYDGIKILVWQNTKDGMSGKNRPELLQERLLQTRPEPKEETVETFEDGDAFRAAWARLTGAENGG